MRPYKFEDGILYLLDQRELPEKEIWIRLESYQEVCEAIKKMVVRGAPVIGIVAGYGFLMGLQKGENPAKVYSDLLNTRPTARNLSWVLESLYNAYKFGEDVFNTLKRIEMEEEERNLKIGEYGKKILGEFKKFLTHCNTGSLATPGEGTALGIIKAIFRERKDIFVWVTETRPFLQGSRLTAWELSREGIAHKIIPDMLAGFLMRVREVDCVVVGADRITKDGHTVNKVGTYTLSVLAREHKIPFYVVAPFSTLDLQSELKDIVLEERNPDEIKEIRGIMIAPQNSDAYNLAFDITPPENISGIITEMGLIHPHDLRYFLHHDISL